MRDGYSTAGSPGTGLGALSRLSAEFQLVSHVGKGTALRFVVPARPPEPQARSALALGAVCVPKPGEVACGDGWLLSRHGAAHTLLVVDGLGHGADAAAAAHVAAVDDVATAAAARLREDASVRAEGLDAALRAELAPQPAWNRA
jgi:hypothetical protein